MDDFGFATRYHLQVAEELGGDRNAHRILSEMERDGLIGSYRMEYKVYYVSGKGKERIGSTKAVKTKGQVDHTLMRNDLYIMLGMPDDWRTEVPIEYSEGKVVCDALFTKANEYHFVEIDNAQTMRNNYDKLKRYAQLKRELFKQYNHVPSVVFYTISNNRRDKLEERMLREGVKGDVYVPQ